MNPKIRRLFIKISIITLTMVIVCSASALLAGQWITIVSASNYTLEKGQSVSGTLLLLSQNAALEEASSVGGSVIMLCCNLTVDGRADGDVFLLTGNLTVDIHADVTGDVNIISGNVSR